MFGAFLSSVLRRDGWAIAVIGSAFFATSFTALIFFASGWTVILSATSETVLSAVVAMLLAVLAMSFTDGLSKRRLRHRNRQLRTAIDSMAQGMCMFDAAERLVVCNTPQSSNEASTNVEHAAA